MKKNKGKKSLKTSSLNLIILVIVILLVLFSLYSSLEKNRAENRIVELKKEVTEIEKEKESVQKIEEEKETNTFEEDISWFVTEVYTVEDRKKLYELIEPSATEEVLIELFGEELPPDENQGEVHSIDKDVENIEVYGNYQDEKHFKGIVTFDLSFDDTERSETAFTVLEVELTKHDDGWKISKLEEYS